MPTAEPIMCEDAEITIADNVGTPVVIGGVLSITAVLSGSRKEIPVTTLADHWVKNLPGKPDGGQIRISIIRDNNDSGQAECVSTLALVGALAVREFVITLSDASTITFDGWVMTGPTSDINDDDVQKGEITVRITDEVVFG